MNTTLVKPTYRTPDRIDARTGHKGFDSACDYLGTGNVISNVQYSAFIRPHGQTECNGHTFAPGVLREFDLKPFRAGYRIPSYILRILAEQTEPVILYVIRHKKRVHGWFVTRAADHRLITCLGTGGTRKSAAVLDFVQPFISTTR